jgi:hypothetical protein
MEIVTMIFWKDIIEKGVMFVCLVINDKFKHFLCHIQDKNTIIFTKTKYLFFEYKLITIF